SFRALFWWYNTLPIYEANNMSTVFDIFLEQQPSLTHEQRVMEDYTKLGFPYNPFRVSQEGKQVPFYKEYMVNELREIFGWVQDIRQGKTKLALSVIGNIGIGKSRIFKEMENLVKGLPSQDRVLAESVDIRSAGLTRPSVGGWLFSTIEKMQLSWFTTELPDGVFPLLWAIICAEPSVDSEQNNPLSKAVNSIRNTSDPETKTAKARILTKWLNRYPLKTSEAEELRLYSRIDSDGVWPTYLCDLIRIAKEVNVLSTFFFFIDQLEDVYQFSESRRIRIFTDLRGLIDEIDNGVPIGLVLSWAPEAQVGGKKYMGATLQGDYAALYTRLMRRKIEMPFLSRDDALPFAKVYVDALPSGGLKPVGFDQHIVDIVNAAWFELERQRRLQGNRTVPRTLLTALGDEVERRAKITV
ncbi:MAG: hypothetical protein NT023_05025, partial [Armatimonadetes bacterium]|nr:hypothetical protein [Armatimonadota bacterium]